MTSVHFVHTSKAKTLMTITCFAWLQFLAQSAFATYKNTGFILLTIVRWEATCSPWSPLTDWFFSLKKLLIRKWIEPPSQAKPTLALSDWIGNFYDAKRHPWWDLFSWILLFQARAALFVLAVPPRKWMIMVPTPGILPGPPGWESKPSLFIQNRNDEIKSTACIQNW